MWFTAVVYPVLPKLQQGELYIIEYEGSIWHFPCNGNCLFGAPPSPVTLLPTSAPESLPPIPTNPTYGECAVARALTRFRQAGGSFGKSRMPLLGVTIPDIEPLYTMPPSILCTPECSRDLLKRSQRLWSLARAFPRESVRHQTLHGPTNLQPKLRHKRVDCSIKQLLLWGACAGMCQVSGNTARGSRSGSSSFGGV